MAWLIDAYRHKNSVILWLKTPNEDIRLAVPFLGTVYVEDTVAVRGLLAARGIAYAPMTKQTCTFEMRKVLAVQVEECEQFVRWFENATRHRVPIFDADLKPELQFLYARGLRPFCTLDPQRLQLLDLEPVVPLSTLQLEIIPCSHAAHAPLAKILFNDHEIIGDERPMLEEFVRRFAALDPDVLVIGHGFLRLPYLVQRLAAHGLSCAFHRWDPSPIAYRGGRSFFTYGQVRYQDYAIRLNGRLLIDTASTFGHCSVDGLIELCQLSGARLQQIASRSPGAVFQMGLLREIHAAGLLIPYKQLPVNAPVSLTELLKADRAGHTMDPKTGFHRNVAEIDFMSMFPWLMYNRNISAEQLLSTTPPFEYAPGLPIRISMARKGFVPRAIYPFLERRMYYKHHPSSINKAKADALKAVLVSSNGYLRFREFKLGMARSHMALCAYARETLLVAKELAEEHGFEVIHGIVDALYLKKPGMTEDEVLSFCKELEMLAGIPVSFEGIFSWGVFLSGVNDIHRPMPARYYGVYRSGSIKARGIEVRQRSTPLLVRRFQQDCLEYLAQYKTKQEIIGAASALGKFLRELMQKHWSKESLICRLRVGREEYAHDVPQKRIVATLRTRGVQIVPGQSISLIHSSRGPVLPEEYCGDPDAEHYERLLLRSLYVLLQPFGFTYSDVLELTAMERQMTLKDYL